MADPLFSVDTKDFDIDKCRFALIASSALQIVIGVTGRPLQTPAAISDNG
ncbi:MULTISPECIES: hypothetical protein [Cupriavidus]|uniref:Uncharacterized protein n=1 Tax=Cupriavidus basilensis TaxID=68895 RepID=A0A7M2H9G5_9BURK|nr:MULTISPECIES: hypothetical protein [Cupriavidus]QOT81624.1 hypothetical protein F7R26_037015 [Cupriavidus basilensis]BDB30170.1 hypothetical protein CTP10_R75870 [Cupriavidus sp. P-10]